MIQFKGNASAPIVIVLFTFTSQLDEICLWNQVNSIRIDDSAETPGKSHVDKFRERALD